jgi:hypothetical protein
LLLTAVLRHGAVSSRRSFSRTSRPAGRNARHFVREQKLLSTVLSELRKQLPFALLALDTDNDSVCMNETLKVYCEQAGIVFTRCRHYRKNDQAFVAPGTATVTAVEAQVSSIKTRRAGSRAGWPSIQSCRRFTTPGRSCSLACAVFFARDPVPGKETADRALAEHQVLLGQFRRSSSIAMSGAAFSMARIVSLCISIRPDLRSPPSAFGRASPCCRSRFRHRLTLAALTPNRSPASRCDAPALTAARTRVRRSSERGLDMPAGLHLRQTV